MSYGIPCCRGVARWSFSCWRSGCCWTTAAATSNAQSGRLPGRYGFVDDRTTQTNEATPDGAVVLGNPVALPVNGDMYTDISTENAMLQGSQ